MSAKTKDPRFAHSDPVVVWWCHHKPRRRVLQVFLTRNGWHVLGNRFRVSMDDWLKRGDSELTAEDIRDGKAAVMDGRRVTGVDKWLQLNIDLWPETGTFEVGCTCHATSAIQAEITWLAEDCRHARDQRRVIERVLL